MYILYLRYISYLVRICTKKEEKEGKEPFQKHIFKNNILLYIITPPLSTLLSKIDKLS